MNIEPRELAAAQESKSPDVRIAPLDFPLQMNLFTRETEPLKLEVVEAPAWQEGEEVELDAGISCVWNENKSQVIVSGYGCFLSKKSERMQVKRPDGKVLHQFPLFRLSEVIVGSRGVGLSSDLLEELCQRGIRVAFLSGGGRPYAMITSPMLNAVVSTRRAQLEAMKDERGLEFSRAIVKGKIRNQAALLRYFGKYLKQANPARYEKITRAADALHGQLRRAAKVGETSGPLTPALSPSEGARATPARCIDDVRHELMGIEGICARIYWEAVQEIVQDKVEFLGRVTRGAQDELNSLLNYGYGILYAQV
jgi:CRISPR-associated protein Cas1